MVDFRMGFTKKRVRLPAFFSYLRKPQNMEVNPIFYLRGFFITFMSAELP